MLPYWSPYISITWWRRYYTFQGSSITTLYLQLWWFSTCSNPLHLSHISLSPAHDTVSTLSASSVIHHYPIHFSSNLSSLPFPSNASPLPGLEVPPNNIIWLSFYSIIHSFGSQWTSWSGNIIQYYMLETSDLYFRIASYFHSSSSIYFTTMQFDFITFIDPIIVDHLNLILLLVLNLTFTVFFDYFSDTDLVITIITVMT